MTATLALIGYVILVLVILLFLAGAKRSSYSNVELAEEDDRQEAWLKAQLAKAAK